VAADAQVTATLLDIWLMFEIIILPPARSAIVKLRRFDQRRVVEAIEKQLVEQPTHQTRNRKKLRPNKLAEWELRVGEFRVFYEVNAAEGVVWVVNVGYKEHGQLFLDDKEYDL
jgi:mRNA-degrading endonuclease RelE of RelBE toxin-antitoxin system